MGDVSLLALKEAIFADELKEIPHRCGNKGERTQLSGGAADS
jgi:hypothetical protein